MPFYSKYADPEVTMIRLVAIQALLFFVAQNALAQNERASCPGLNEPTSAERQASCWFERALSGSTECAEVRNGVNACIRHAAGWCTEAAFDEPSVANICFWAHLQAGQFEDAQALKRYIVEPTTDVTRCLQALESTKVKFASIPIGAELRVNGQQYGKAPVEVELKGSWWKDKVVASFGSDRSATEVEVSQQELKAAFDKKRCLMEEVTVKGPQKPPASVAETVPAEVVKPPTDATMQTSSGVSLPAVILLAVGGAGVITGVVLLAIAATNAVDLKSQEKGTTWTRELEDKDKSLEPLSIGGGIALGVGAAVATLGIVLITTDGESSTSVPDDKESYELSLKGQGIELAGRF